MRWARGLGLACLVMMTALAGAQELNLPWGKAQRLASPDGSRILYGVSYRPDVNPGPQLWIEDTRTQRRTKLFDIGSTLVAAWSPDGAAFYVNNHWASDREQAYIFDAATLDRVDLGARIRTSDPATKPFTDGHAYYRVTRWEGNDHMAVSFFGHTDETPVQCFTFRYRVSRTGVVEKLSQRVRPATATACDEAP